ncbi:N-acetyltransferase [Sporosarcina sp. YIM B06819]|uniref:GNAT family N-acetyltransferase n=1 Tax=Sporosarcina sp. YIM B06819 TaxID=3081769 RepID=UPI00298CBA42|nr:N-acetyltransferase [Sporosarcina sp. YIM B06819]
MIRVEQPQDFTAIKQVNDLAFEQEGESNLIAKLRTTDTFIPELSLVFENEQRDIVGHILFSLITIETAQGSVESLALAPVAVKPGSQNKGIGSALIKEGLKRSQGLGYDSVVVLGHSSYYPKFGFQLASSKGITAPFDVTDEAFMVIELRTGALDDVQGTVNYPPAFSDV